MGIWGWEVSGLGPIAVILVDFSGSTYPGHAGEGYRGRPKRGPFPLTTPLQEQETEFT